MNTKSMQKHNNLPENEKSIKSYSKESDLVKTELFGVGITNETEESILEFIINSVQKKGKPYYVVTPNPEMVVLSTRNSQFRQVLNNAKIATNDGIGLGIAGQILRKPLKQRLTGVQLLEDLCKEVTDWPITVAFLGGQGNVAEKTKECLQQKYPRLRVTFAGSDLPHNKLPETDILFVAYGAPKQELWMAEHIGKMPVRVMIGVGGAFDYLSGSVARAPRLVRTLGFEWLFRLVVQPWRWRRQVALPLFAWMVLKEKLGK